MNVESFERVALPSLEIEEGRILIIDEIGKMECCSEKFVRSVEKAFDAGKIWRRSMSHGRTGRRFRNGLR